VGTLKNNVNSQILAGAYVYVWRKGALNWH
jgi:NADH:ubiquinone oxidoreductase subunit 3 (subunit A)